MNKLEVIKKIFKNGVPQKQKHEKGLAFAPTNIAICKYWGKRDRELNLPMTSSLSVSLPDKGALTTISLHDGKEDQVVLNQTQLDAESDFVKRVRAFLDLFREKNTWYLNIETNVTIPIAAGLASSACGFASLTLALKDLFDWELNFKELSILARLGSGSAARSFWNGFVEWHAGAQSDGMDSFAEPLPYQWPELRVGIVTLSDQPKPISSRQAMQQTVDSSTLYHSWPKKVTQDLIIVKQALNKKLFSLFGGAAESNALSMHATMLSSWPPICYFIPETIAAMKKVWDLRNQGLQLYFTQDAGPNLKLLFLEKDKNDITSQFPGTEIIEVFNF